MATVKLLLDAGACVNAPATKGIRSTALQAAVESQRLDTVQLLLQFGADVNAPATNQLQRTALQGAAEKGNQRMIDLLLKASADVNAPPAPDGGVTALQACAIGGYIPLAVTLINEGADVNALPAKKNGRTALEGAAEHGRLDMVQMLLEAGADLDGPGARQYSRAVRFASERARHAVRRLLESHYASRTVRQDAEPIDASESPIPADDFDTEQSDSLEHQTAAGAALSPSITHDWSSSELLGLGLADFGTPAEVSNPPFAMAGWSPA